MLKSFTTVFTEYNEGLENKLTRAPLLGLVKSIYWFTYKSHKYDTYSLSGSRAIALGSSNAEEIKVSWLFPSKSDTDILLYVVSVQYNWDVLHWTANPSQTPILVITVVVFSSPIRSRLMFSSVTSLQNMKPRLKWTSIATALVRPRITEFTFAFPWSTATISVVFDTNKHGGVQMIAMNRKIRSRKNRDSVLL